MIASDQFAGFRIGRDRESALARVSQRTFGDNAWVKLALEGCAQYLAPAIRSGRSHRIASAVRAIAHAPTAEQVNDVIAATCESMLAEGYAEHDETLTANVAKARSVIATVVTEIRERTERESVAPALLRETVDAYVQIVALLNKRLAERLDAVGDLSARIAVAMGLSPALQLECELAGRLHDIGTLTIPGMICAANAFERHPVAGATFVEGVPSLRHLAPIIRSHHERFDGRGYPDGMSAAEIPLAARVIAVAATFVDLIGESPAHEAFLPNQACHQISLAAGTQFDPDVVAATMQLLRFRQRTKRSA